MCPQANASIALLSNVDEDGEGQQGEKVLLQIASKCQVDCKDAEGSKYSYDKTVCGYLMAKIDKRGFKFKDFLCKLTPFNDYLPSNMYLLCGDNYLEVIAKRLDAERSLPPATGGPWRKVTEFMKAFVDGVVSTDQKKRTYTFFIDTNPSFTVYTELAVLAGTKLIVPFNADDFSRTAVKSVVYLLYGKHIYDERQVQYKDLQEYEFWYRAQQENLDLPKIHLLINNKVTTYRKVAAKAFAAKECEIYSYIHGVMKEIPSLFENPDDFKIMHHLDDFHTVAVQCLHLGCPLRNLPATIEMANMEVENATKNKNVYLEKLEVLVKLL